MAIDQLTELSLMEELQAAVDSGDQARIDKARQAYRQATEEPSFWSNNLEIPGGIGGALAGAAAGSAILPGIGTVIGGIAGGALGSAGGSVAEDIVADRDIDVGEAVKEGAYSAAFDIAFLGAGKVLKPMAKALGFGVQDLVSSFNKADPLKPAVEATAGSLTSLQQTQNVLEQAGGSLSAYQTGRAGGLRSFAEGIGDIGILSSSRTAAREASNMKALQAEADRILSSLGDESLPADELGRATSELINEGREAAQSLYGKGLDELQRDFGLKQLDTFNLFKPLNALLNEKTLKVGEETRSELASAVVKEVESALKFLGGGRNISVKDAIRFERTLNQQVNKMAKIGTEGYDDVASGQLFEFMNRYRKAMAESMEKLDPRLASSYRALKDNYSSAMTGMLPTPTAGLIKQANKGMYQSLGRALVTANDPDKVKGFMGAIDTAYEQLRKAGGSAYIVKEAAAAKNIVKRSFLQNIFGQDTTQMPVQKLVTLAKSLDNPTQASKFRTILGESFVDFRRLVNSFADVSNKRGSDHFVLALRSKEVQGLGAGASFFSSGIGGPLAILFTPVVLSRIATNKGAVNRLLTMKKAIDKNGAAYSPEFVGAWAAKVIESLDDESKSEIAEYMQTVSIPQGPQQATATQ